MVNNKKLALGIIGIMILVSLMTVVSAHRWACLSYGDKIPYYTCHSTSCKLCLDDKGYSTSFGYCKTKPSCDIGPANNDTTPPVLTLFSPTSGTIFKQKTVLFNLTTDEPSTISYTDNINGNGRWVKIAGNSLKYTRGLGFKDGFIDLTIRAEDRHSNYVDVKRSFYVDTKKPKVDSPGNDGKGNIKFRFDEANPVSLTLKYGNNKTGYGSYAIDLKNCNGTNAKYTCQYFISKEQRNSMLKSYDGQEIESWMELKDIAGNIGKSKILKEKVDVTAPVINNPSNMFTKQGRYILFNISITEQNLLGVYYAENLTNLKWQKICSSLNDGLCKKKVTFSKGNHNIIIQVLDKSGNYVNKQASFSIS